VYIEDLGSYNGIRINGNRVAGKSAVAEGDRIQIGDYQLALRADRAQTAAREPFMDAKTQPEVDHAVTMRETQPTAPMGAPAPAANGTVEPVPATPPPLASEATPQDVMDIAETVPVQTQPAPPARLVVISSNFAGQEFKLDKPKVVIGRVDDNDVV